MYIIYTYIYKILYLYEEEIMHIYIHMYIRPIYTHTCIARVERLPNLEYMSEPRVLVAEDNILFPLLYYHHHAATLFTYVNPFCSLREHISLSAM